jgi:hypothetical protein
MASTEYNVIAFLGAANTVRQFIPKYVVLRIGFLQKTTILP